MTAAFPDSRTARVAVRAGPPASGRDEAPRGRDRASGAPRGPRSQRDAQPESRDVFPEGDGLRQGEASRRNGQRHGPGKG